MKGTTPRTLKKTSEENAMPLCHFRYCSRAVRMMRARIEVAVEKHCKMHFGGKLAVKGPE